MISFVRKYFREMYSLFLWVCLIALVVAGARFGLAWFGDNIFGFIFGVVLGGAAGVITVVMVGGLVATFLNIDENIQRIADSISGIKHTQRTADSISGIKHTVDESV